MIARIARHPFSAAVAVIMGTVIGAGVFGVPYALQQTGLPLGLIVLAVIGALVVLTSLAYGEIVARTPTRHQLPGYVNIYLGSAAKRIAIGAMIVGTLGAHIAYIAEIGVFLSSIFEDTIGGSPLTYSLLFFAVASIAVFFGLGMVVRFEQLMVVALLVVLGILVVSGIPHIDVQNYAVFRPGGIFLPFGVVLFAATGAAAIPAVHDLLKAKPRLYRHAILTGYILPLLLYAIFSLVVIGVTGEETTESAVLGLGISIGTWVLFLGATFGVLTMSSSFLTSGLYLRDMYRYDMHISRGWAWILALLPPLLIVMLNPLTFVEVIAIVGAVIGGTNGILIILTWMRARNAQSGRKPAYQLRLPVILIGIMFAMYVFGFVYELVGLLE